MKSVLYWSTLPEPVIDEVYESLHSLEHSSHVSYTPKRIQQIVSFLSSVDHPETYVPERIRTDLECCAPCSFEESPFQCVKEKTTDHESSISSFLENKAKRITCENGDVISICVWDEYDESYKRHKYQSEHTFILFKKEDTIYYGNYSIQIPLGYEYLVGRIKHEQKRYYMGFEWIGMVKLMEIIALGLESDLPTIGFKMLRRACCSFPFPSFTPVHTLIKERKQKGNTWYPLLMHSLESMMTNKDVMIDHVILLLQACTYHGKPLVDWLQTSNRQTVLKQVKAVMMKPTDALFN